MGRLRAGMVVAVYERFAVREGPIGRAELVERDRPNPAQHLGALRRGGRLETWRVRYVDPPPEGYRHGRRPEWVTVRTDEPDLREGAAPPGEGHGRRVGC